MSDYISRYANGAAVDNALDLAMSALQPESGKGLSTNDFTNEYKDKVDSNDSEISSARGSYITVNDRLNAIESEQESQGAELDEDRAALVELVDSGAKNLVQNIATSATVVGVDFTVNSDGTIIADGTASTAAWFSITNNITLPIGAYVISGGQVVNGTVNVRVVLSTSETAASIIADSNGDSTLFICNSPTTATVYVRMSTGRTADNVLVKPMICTKAAWDISKEYVPYRPSYDELIARIEALEAGT